MMTRRGQLKSGRVGGRHLKALLEKAAARRKKNKVG